jgi:ASTRA-associated protein 1
MCQESVNQPDPDEPAAQLIASPNGLDSGGIDIFGLPSETRLSQIKSEKSNPTGMVMALTLFHRKAEPSAALTLISGYEDGRVMVYQLRSDPHNPSVLGQWHKTMTSKAHTQPVLSLELPPSKTNFFTSSADAAINKFSTSHLSLDVPKEKDLKPEKAVNTKHAGQQGLTVRTDGRIFATAGWDGRARVYSCKTMKELAVLKWHKVGVYSTAFAGLGESADQARDATDDGTPHTDNAADSMPESAAKPTNALDIIRQQRTEKAQRTHWLAVGGKDGKISLWDIY